MDIPWFEAWLDQRCATNRSDVMVHLPAGSALMEKLCPLIVEMARQCHRRGLGMQFHLTDPVGHFDGINAEAPPQCLRDYYAERAPVEVSDYPAGMTPRLLPGVNTLPRMWYIRRYLPLHDALQRASCLKQVDLIMYNYPYDDFGSPMWNRLAAPEWFDDVLVPGGLVVRAEYEDDSPTSALRERFTQITEREGIIGLYREGDDWTTQYPDGHEWTDLNLNWFEVWQRSSELKA
jgi:hypothetical protein